MRRNAHEMWILEAKLDVYRELHADGRATEEEVQTRWREARAGREACRYCSDSPDWEGCAFEDVDLLDSDSWYNDVYRPGYDRQDGDQP